MSEIDLLKSMKPKLDEIATQILLSYELEIEHGEGWLRAVLDTGKWLDEARKIITTEAWPRWCAEEPNFSARTIHRRIQFWLKYDALTEPEQASLLASTGSIRSATKFIECKAKTETCDIPATRVSLRGHDITGSKQETTLAGSKLAAPSIDPDPGGPQEVTDSDPWRPVKQEIATVYGDVSKGLQWLRDQIAIARGYGVFDFVSEVVEQDLANLAGTIKMSKPTAECPTCRAQTPEQAKNCGTCKAVGLVPKHYAERGR